MRTECEVIRDLLPLYADDACSGRSRELVEEHLKECQDCSRLLKRLKETEIETDMYREKESVLQEGKKRFRRRSAEIGTIVSGIFMIPILVCLIINIFTGSGLGWFFIVLASLAVAASLIIVPLMVPENKAFWMFCSFCASLMVLLGVVCLYTRGRWFWIASSASLFGLSVVFLPFVIKARPVKALIGAGNKLLIVLVLDAALFINMMNMITSRGKFTVSTILFTLGVLAGIGLVVTEVLRKREDMK